MFIACYMCYVTRKLPTTFNGGNNAALGMLANFQILVVGLPLVVLVGSDYPSISFFIRSAIIWMNDLAVVVIIFGNLMFRVHGHLDGTSNLMLGHNENDQVNAAANRLSLRRRSTASNSIDARELVKTRADMMNAMVQQSMRDYIKRHRKSKEQQQLPPQQHQPHRTVTARNRSSTATDETTTHLSLPISAELPQRVDNGADGGGDSTTEDYSGDVIGPLPSSSGYFTGNNINLGDADAFDPRLFFDLNRGGGDDGNLAGEGDGRGGRRAGAPAAGPARHAGFGILAQAPPRPGQSAVRRDVRTATSPVRTGANRSRRHQSRSG